MRLMNAKKNVVSELDWFDEIHEFGVQYDITS